MRRLLLAALAATMGSGIGIVTAATAAPQPAAGPVTCMVWQNPTVELVWSKVCHF